MVSHSARARWTTSAPILAEYGNMSAPTALFVLERVIRAGLPARTLLTAMGPGFTASCVSLRRAA
jgi:alkylresorcinol/alkylpyrone synthase